MKARTELHAIFATILFAFCFHARAELVEEHRQSSYAEGKQFAFQVTRQQLLNAPVWNPNGDSPPLPPRAAQKAATAKLRDLLKDTKDWEIGLYLA